MQEIGAGLFALCGIVMAFLIAGLFYQIVRGWKVLLTVVGVLAVILSSLAASLWVIGWIALKVAGVVHAG